MKKTSNKRLQLEGSTIRHLAIEQLRRVNAGLPTDDDTEEPSESSGTISMSPGPSYSGCPSANSCTRCNT